MYNLGMSIKAFDFFCGAGGLTRGLLDAGIQVLAGIDNDPGLEMTYSQNNTPSNFICKGIDQINIQDLRTDYGVTQGDIVLYAACTPCQPFSTLNRMKGKDDRKELLLEFAKLVESVPPDFILVENVPGLNTAFGKEIYEKFIAAISRAGFTHRYAEQLDAKDFGVPQVRKRFIMIASRHGEVVPPECAKSVAKIEDYIRKYPSLKAGEKSPEYHNHEARPLMPHHKVIVAAVPKDGGSRRDIADQSILLKCHQNNPTVHKDVFGRMKWDQPAPTLTCRCTDIYCGRFTHPDQDRGISLREAAALQTFPDEYKFYGSAYLHLSRQIGNAVPVKFAQRLGEAVLKSAEVIRYSEMISRKIL